jgi:SAM-dependent methyltransferase
VIEEAVEGACSVCGEWGRFVHGERPIRESYPCPACGATLRYRHQAGVLLSLYAREGSRCLRELAGEQAFSALAIYEPGIIGPFRRLFAGLPSYTTSYYWPDVAPGELHEGVRCEDLHALTFAGESFDLVISSDIFEHVRRPLLAFAEVRRVLRPGGRHVFTVPLKWPVTERTVPRVDVGGPEDVHLLPPVYHGSPRDPQGSLVYNDFGTDLVQTLAALGLATRIVEGLMHNVTFVSVRV